MTLDLLNKIMPTLQTVCNTVYETKQFTAAFTKAFHALLRIGEFTVSKGNTPATILLFDDISMQQIKIHWQSIIQKWTNKVWGQTCTFLLQIMLLVLSSPACPLTDINIWIWPIVHSFWRSTNTLLSIYYHFEALS